MCMSLFRNTCIALFAQCFGETTGHRSATFDTSFCFYAALCWGICRPNVACELAGELGQGDFELAAQPWIAAQGRCFERVLD